MISPAGWFPTLMVPIAGSGHCELRLGRRIADSLHESKLLTKSDAELMDAHICGGIARKRIRICAAGGLGATKRCKMALHQLPRKSRDRDATATAAASHHHPGPDSPFFSSYHHKSCSALGFKFSTFMFYLL